jgi:hypothetical protein
MKLPINMGNILGGLQEVMLKDVIFWRVRPLARLHLYRVLIFNNISIILNNFFAKKPQIFSQALYFL